MCIVYVYKLTQPVINHIAFIFQNQISILTHKFSISLSSFELHLANTDTKYTHRLHMCKFHITYWTDKVNPRCFYTPKQQPKQLHHERDLRDGREQLRYLFTDIMYDVMLPTMNNKNNNREQDEERCSRATLDHTIARITTTTKQQEL